METTIYEGEEYYQVLPGYSFVTFDIVAEPSVHGSYMSVMESKNNTRKRNYRGDYERQAAAEVRNILKGLR